MVQELDDMLPCCPDRGMTARLLHPWHGAWQNEENIVALRAWAHMVHVHTARVEEMHSAVRKVGLALCLGWSR